MPGTRKEMNEYLFKTLSLQISIYTGKREGSLSVLQVWYNNIHLKKENTICECCGENIEKGGHKDTCEIVIDYSKHFNL